MYIIVYNENNEYLDTVSTNKFGPWLDLRNMGIVSFLSSDDICEAIVGELDA